MRWHHLTLRRPKRWSRRAKSDGSAAPKLTRIKLTRFSSFQRLILWFGPFAFVLFALVGLANSIYIDLYLDKHWVTAVLPSAFSMRTAFFVPMVGLTVMFLFCLSMVAVCSHATRLRRKLSQQAIRHRCHLCPRCGYDLRPRTSDAQPCPECGQRISRREAVRLWARFAGS